MNIADLLAEWGAIGPERWAESRFGWLLDDGQPITFSPWQKALFAALEAHRAEVNTLLISTVKKAGKTTLNSLITCHRWLTMPGLHFVIGNDKDQSSELQINIIGAMVKRHPLLKTRVKINKSELVFKPTGSRLVSLPIDFTGNAGSNHLTVSYTELWGFVYESAVRLYEELTLPPLVDGLKIIDSYAGFDGESDLLRRLWDRGEAGQPVDDDWPIRLSGGMLSYIHTGIDAQRRCWRGTETGREKYYTEQRRDLREATYKRLHLNEWGTPESSFIPAEWWEQCYDPALRPIAPGNSTPLVLSLDLARGVIGGDSCALTAVSAWRDGWAVRYCRVWQASAKGVKFDHAALIGPELNWLINNFHCLQLAYDEYEAEALIKLFRGRIWCKPFSQASPRELADKYLYDSIVSGQIYHYNDETLTKHVLNAAAHDKGENKLRLIKSTPYRKIDAAVTLSMGLFRAQYLNLSPDPASLAPLASDGTIEAIPEGPVTAMYLPKNGTQAGAIRIQTMEGQQRIEPGDVVTIPPHVWANIQQEPPHRRAWQIVA